MFHLFNQLENLNNINQLEHFGNLNIEHAISISPTAETKITMEQRKIAAETQYINTETIKSITIPKKQTVPKTQIKTQTVPKTLPKAVPKMLPKVVPKILTPPPTSSPDECSRRPNSNSCSSLKNCHWDTSLSACFSDLETIDSTKFCSKFNGQANKCNSREGCVYSGNICKPSFGCVGSSMADCNRTKCYPCIKLNQCFKKDDEPYCNWIVNYNRYMSTITPPSDMSIISE